MGVSFQVYTLESRVAFAGWTQSNIDNYKGPTPEVVSGLAENVRLKLGSTYTVCEVRNVHLRSKGAMIVWHYPADEPFLHCRVEQPARRAERLRTGHRKSAPVCLDSVSVLD